MQRLMKNKSLNRIELAKLPEENTMKMDERNHILRMKLYDRAETFCAKLCELRPS